MSLFQKSVLNKYYNELSIPQIQASFLEFQAIFNNPIKQQNILNAKEEQYQEGFLRELFVQILGYTLYPDGNHNLITEQKNEKNSKKSDGAILNGLNVIAVIELKSTKTVDLASIESQAFGYKNNQQECKYVITSNFKKLRFYIDNAVEFLEFDLFNLTFDDFKLMWVCLSANYLLKNIPAQIKEASNHQEEKITKQLYADYAKFRTELFNDICTKNTDYDRLFLFKKTQKLLDRFLFLFFAEDRGLVAPNWTRKILQDWTDLKDRYDNYIPLYTRFRKNFDYLNTGYHGKDGDVFAYNGGLFAPDEVLDSLTIDDDLLYKGSLKLSNYDFDSEVDVNILGHIFEHSLSEIDEIQASLAETKVEKVTKRKKDGVFYTPKYITKYIVENTIGTLCIAQKEKLEIIEEDFEFIEKGKKKKRREELNQKINDYRAWLLDLKIVDPACGSGAFLNQALEFLIAEHTKLDELRARLLGGSIVLSDVETSILENNLYGVDINDEAVEIAKLSLWLRTARKGRKLNSLNNNLKCGNSLIDDVAITGDKAFNWNLEFKEVFDKGGFDVVIGNPPYIKEATNKTAFNYLHDHPCYQGKMDLWYFFGWLALDLIKKNEGFIGFIAPNNWITNDGASRFRNKIISEGKIVEFIDFGDYKVFESAGIQTMIYLMKNDDDNYDYSLKYSKLTNKNVTVEKISDFLNKLKSNDAVIYETNVNKRELLTSPLNFSNNLNRITLTKIRKKGTFFLLSDEINSGIDIGQDFVNAKSKLILGNDFNVGDGIFNLSNTEFEKYRFSETEKKILKPFFTTKEIFRYKTLRQNNYWVIYTTSNFRDKNAINSYPTIKDHLDKFESIITSDNKPYGLHRSRAENIFKGEKILSIRKCARPSFSYVDFDTYVNRTFNIIKSDRIDLKYLTSILNSNVVKFWLREMGKLQGDMFQVDMNPILSIPIILASKKNEAKLKTFVESLISLNQELEKHSERFKSYFAERFTLNSTDRLRNWFDLSFNGFCIELNKTIKLLNGVTISKKDEFDLIDLFEEQKNKALAIKNQIEQIDKEIDRMVYELYELTEEEIKIVEDIV